MRLLHCTGRLSFFDGSRSNPRAAMGKVALATPATGAATSYQTQVALYDAEGNVIWKALR